MHFPLFLAKMLSSLGIWVITLFDAFVHSFNSFSVSLCAVWGAGSSCDFSRSVQMQQWILVLSSLFYPHLQSTLINSLNPCSDVAFYYMKTHWPPFNRDNYSFFSVLSTFLQPLPISPCFAHSSHCVFLRNVKWPSLTKFLESISIYSIELNKIV